MKRKIFKRFLYVIGGLFAIAIGLAIILWIKSPGIADPITDANGKIIPGSISVIEKIKLGGQEQYLIIRGKDSTKPVMLFLHGGPGSPEFILIKSTNRSIENDFVMVYWEQRGAGKSYSNDVPIESMNLTQFISDAKELSIYLANRFRKDKIYIMGHSWGSLLGILTAHQYPELYYAYFGIGQACSPYRGEKISFEWAKEQAKIQKKMKVLEGLSKMAFPDSLASGKVWEDYLIKERNYVTQLRGGVTHKMTSMLPLIGMLLNAKEYTVADKINFIKGSLFSVNHLWPELMQKNLFCEIDSIRIPVYIFQGKYDNQTPYPIAKEFFNQLKAPKKEFFSFKNSAHTPIMEEVDKFNSIVLKETR